MGISHTSPARAIWLWPRRRLRLNKLRRIRAARHKGDHPRVSLYKALTWRLLASADTVLLSWLLTSRLSLAITVGAGEFLTKLCLYYLHERAWARVSFGIRKGKEKPARSLLKALSWRATGTLDTVMLSLLLTGNTTTALSIGGLELISKTLLYFLHERLWARWSQGRSTGEF